MKVQFTYFIRPILILIIVYLLLRLLSSSMKSGMLETFSCTPKFARYDPMDKLSTPDNVDPILTGLYHRIHDLENIARMEIARNNDVPGGSQGVPRERIALERINRRISSIKNKIDRIIESRRIVTQPPLLYSSNPMISLPSHPGMVYNQRLHD